MKLAIEISLYPLEQQYISHIKAFIQRMNTYDNLYVNTTHTSTMVSGEYDYLMNVIKQEMQTTYEQVGQAIFVCKFLNADNMSLDAKP